MRIFLSHSTPDATVAEEIAVKLGNEGHRVFFDRRSLAPGSTFDERIRREIERSELFLFLVSAQALEPGRYCLTELRLAQERWPNPEGRVLPVLLETLELKVLPPYLRSVTVLQAEGNLPAEVAHWVARRSQERGRRRFVFCASAMTVVLALAAGGAMILRHRPVDGENRRSLESPGPDQDALALGRGVEQVKPAVGRRLRSAAWIREQFVVALDDPPELATLTPSGDLVSSNLRTGSPVSLVAAQSDSGFDGTLANSSVNFISCFHWNVGNWVCRDYPIPVFYLSNKGDRKPAAQKPFAESHPLSNVPASTAVCGKKVWVLTQKDGTAESGLLLFDGEKENWEAPTYQNENDLSFDLKDTALLSAGGVSAWGLTSSTPHYLYRFGEKDMETWSGHDNLETVGAMSALWPEDASTLLGLGSDFEPLDFVPVEGGRIEVKRRWPKLGGLYSTASWDASTILRSGDHFVVALTSYVRGNDFHAVAASLAEFREKEHHWRKLFTLSDVESVALCTNANGTLSLWVVRDRLENYAAYWIKSGG